MIIEDHGWGSGGGSAGAGSAGPTIAEAATAEAPCLHMHLVTLQLTPKALEDHFWTDVGDPNFSASDKWALIFTTLTV